MKSFFILLFIASGFTSFSQDLQWWKKKHNWDGHSHYSRYMTFSPAYFGPNALPVPEFHTGEIFDVSYLRTAVESHLSSGDNTFNLFGKAYLPFAKNKIAIEIYGVPLEYFQMDTVTRDERAALNFDSKGWANGDLYFGTIIQILKNRSILPDMTLSMYCRTASGNNTENARYTDKPGYFFDMAFGKDIMLSDEDWVIRPFGLLGLYVWQTNIPYLVQNDAFMFALGSILKIKELEISQSWGGYMGYMDKGDKPTVIRTSVSNNSGRIGYKFLFQQGLKDFNYTTFSLGLQYNFSVIN